MEIKYSRAKPYFSVRDKTDIIKKIGSVLSTGMLTQGKYVEEFENQFALKIGTKYAIATSSCTSALEVAIRSLGIKNKKILVPTQTFVASVNAIILSGNIPVILDIDEAMCISAEQTIEYINTKSNIGAVMWVHMAGLISPKFEKIKSICSERGIYIIEDAAHAHGASLNHIKAGNLGDAGCFSFYPTKLMATGEGGMITTNNEKVDREARILRSHGTIRHEEKIKGLDYGVDALYVSQNFRMTEISAILGLSQLRHLNAFVAKRNYIADRYRKGLTKVKEIKFLPQYKEAVYSYWNFYCILDRSINREQFAKSLLYDFGIQNANAYDPPCHVQSLYKHYINKNDFTVANDMLSRHISLPMYYELLDKDIQYIITSVIKILDRTR
jgi:dTDP-4-amino-4,6-dideoxygalactose transaminase